MLVSRLSWSFSEMQSWSWRCKYTHASLCTYCDIFAYYIYYPYIFSENWVTKLSFPCELHSFCFSAPRDNKTRLYRFTDQNTPFLTIIHTIQYLLLSVCCLYRFKNLKKKKKKERAYQVKPVVNNIQQRGQVSVESRFKNSSQMERFLIRHIRLQL